MAELFAGRGPASTAGDRLDEVQSARMPGCPFLWLLSLTQRILRSAPSGTASPFAPLLRRSGETKESDSLAEGE
jgi:hypothetical protein